MKRYQRNPISIFATFVFLVSLLPLSASAQTGVEPGFNLLSVEQDIEIGREASRQIESEQPVLRDESVNDYVARLGQRLAQYAPHGDYPYQFRVLNRPEVNAFALPGGFIYVNRGLLETVGSEAELAGVLAHEISHVALRHGTNQASKAYLASAGLGILGSLFGDGSTTGDIVAAAGGLGLNTAFLKFSRDDEEDADIVGAQILARAGYNPLAMVDMFAALQGQQSRDPSAVEEFFSSHPPYDDRQETVREEATLINVEPKQPLGGFASMQRELVGIPVADVNPPADDPADLPRADDSPATRAPYHSYVRYRHDKDYFAVSHPESWVVLESTGFGVTLAPRDGFVESNGRREVVYGAIIQHFESSNRSSEYMNEWARGFAQVIDPQTLEAPRRLERATLEVVDELLQTNPHLDVERRSAETTAVDGEPAVVLWLSGYNPATRDDERVTLITREAGGDEHLVYMLLIAPEDDHDDMSPVFQRIVSSLRVNDNVSHSR